MEHSTPQLIPKDYNDYALSRAKASLKYSCPIGAASYILFFLWDLLFTPSWRLALTTLGLRFLVAGMLMGFWVFMPRLKSLKFTMICLSVMYVFVLMNFMLIMSILPGAFINGESGLLMIVFMVSGMFSLRPVPAAITGLIGIATLVFACTFVKLTLQETASALVYFAMAIAVSCGFAVLLEREFRRRHVMELAFENEKEQSERLLKEILPRYVIQRLREGAEVIAESLSEVNVLFMDIVGFTVMSRRLAPKHLIEVLSEIFGAFDSKCEKYGVTKIKTIGDAYMAATGAPEGTGLSAVNAVQFCLEAIEAVHDISKRTGIPINIRVGLATGAAISGVLSLKRPAYDLWGETINLASRLESTGEAGRVQIAETTYWRVKETFACEARGIIEVKGIGSVQSYFIAQKKPEVADSLSAVG